ncbi:protein FIP1-like isoform X3 [Typha latifolia]|uniref:protein FIP1-like isoform X3 n=1 Tax=Typha latifolia TaxID=4733 RepID=UPI003C2C6113
MSHERGGASSAALSAEENSLFLDILQDAPLSGNRQPRGIFGSILYCLILVGYAVVAAAAPWIFILIPKLIPTLLCSCNIILLIITSVFQQYWVYQVRKVRLQGYYTFSQKMKHIARLPFPTIAYGTALMLLVIIWHPYIHILSVSVLLRVTMVAEVICAGCFMSAYIVFLLVCAGCIHKYNSLNGQPDVLKSLYSALQPSNSLDEPRYYDGGRLSDQQMALLQYQRENLHYLSEEVDLAHLLASRDQELRALSAEMNQVHSELRLARSLIAERDSEIQSILVTNNQYVEENERLRAILGEWSARAAKLERALEAERVSNMELQKSITKLRSQPAVERQV